jgi:hypothetical protein
VTLRAPTRLDAAIAPATAAAATAVVSLRMIVPFVRSRARFLARMSPRAAGQNDWPVRFFTCSPLIVNTYRRENNP